MATRLRVPASPQIPVTLSFTLFTRTWLREEVTYTQRLPLLPSSSHHGTREGAPYSHSKEQAMLTPKHATRRAHVKNQQSQVPGPVEIIYSPTNLSAPGPIRPAEPLAREQSIASFSNITLFTVDKENEHVYRQSQVQPIQLYSRSTSGM